jgi:hypothetical protein
MKKSQKTGAHPNASTGPRSAEGKARSSMNALKSGIYSKSLTIPGEDPARLTALLEEYFQRYRPAVPEQRDLVDILVRSTWTLRRLAVAEAQVYSHEMDRANHLDQESPIGHAFCLSDRTLSRLQRMINSTQRNYRDALHELERLQSLPLDIEPPPGAQTSSPPKPGPTLVPDINNSPQQSEAKPVNQSEEFVSSSSTPPPPAAQKDASKSPQKPLPFHPAGAQPDDCYRNDHQTHNPAHLPADSSV